MALAVMAGLFLMRSRPHLQTAVEWPTVARSNLVLRAGCWYLLQSTNAFTGWLVDAYPDGTLHSRIAVSNGLLNGVCESWFTNGVIQSREYFKGSVSDGRREEWFANGQRRTQADIVNGKMEGMFRRWYDDGQLAEEIEMKHGQPDGLAMAYYRSGFIKAETRARDGQVSEQKRWTDGERREGALE